MAEDGKPKGLIQQGWRTKDPVVLPPANRPGKVNIQFQKTDDLVISQGVRVKVYRTTYCPNVKSIDGSEHEIDCPLCNGAQFIDRHCLETTAFIQSQINEANQFPEGIYDGNTVAATFMRGVELQYFTLVELVDFTEIYIQRVKRQEGPVDVLRYRAVVVNMVMDKNGKEYYEGPDFNIDLNGNIKWCSNKGPDSDTIYSIHYETAVRYRATKAMHTNRFNNITFKEGDLQLKINEQWSLEKVYFVEDRKNYDGSFVKPNKIRNDDEEFTND